MAPRALLGPAASVILAAAFCQQCGGRAEVTSTTDAGPDGGVGLMDGGNSSDPCTVSGVRICGGECRWLDNAQCPGGGCTALTALDGTALSVGICWSDTPEGHLACAACGDGSACMQRGSAGLVCVPASVCERLWELGSRDVCRYADKERFDGRPLPIPSGCPAGASPITCGGACPACALGTAHRCVGRSPDHPFGVCPPIPSTADPNSAASIPTCSLTGSTYAEPCPPSSGQSHYVCGVFRTPGSEQDVAKQYGLCMGQDLCVATGSALPGGMDCFDASGVRVGP